MSSAVAAGPVRRVEPVREDTDVGYPYPGIPTTCDGAEAVVHVEIHVAQGAGAYPITSRTSEATQTPFFNVQDGFLTTHTVETVRLPEPQFMKEFIGDPKEKLINLMDPANPVMSGVVQNQDSYMKGKIAQRWYYERVMPALEEAFEIFHQKTGRKYGFLEPYRCDDADYILVGLGCY